MRILFVTPEHLGKGELELVTSFSDRQLLVLKDNQSENQSTVSLSAPEDLQVGELRKIAFQYAIDNNFDIVCDLIDEQIPTSDEVNSGISRFELEPDLAALFAVRKQDANLEPLLRWGRTLTVRMCGLLTGTHLSELHSGYRMYRVQPLSQIPFEKASQDQLFQIEIAMQLHSLGVRIEEFQSAIPHHLDQPKRSIAYAYRLLKLAFLRRVQKLGLFYDPRFDLSPENTHYVEKFDFQSSHSFALSRVNPNDKVLLVGSGPASLVKPYRDKGAVIYALDQYVAPELAAICEKAQAADLNQISDFDMFETEYSKIFALDIIEHLASPESFLESLRNSQATRNSRLILTTPNIGFLPIRLMLLFGQFNYGKRGILDRTHTRLFTFKSLRLLLIQHGFQVEVLKGVPAPFPLAIGRSATASLFLKINEALISISKSLFSFQIYIEAEPLPTAKALLQSALTAEERLLANR